MGANEFKYIDGVNVFVGQALNLKNGQLLMYGVMYFTEVLHNGHSLYTELSFADSVLMKQFYKAFPSEQGLSSDPIAIYKNLV